MVSIPLEPPAIHAHTPSLAELGEPGPRLGSGTGHGYLPPLLAPEGTGKTPTPWQKQQHPGRTHFLSGPRWGPWPGAWGCCILHRQKVLWLPQGQCSLTSWPVAATPWFVLPRLLLVPGVSRARLSVPPMRTDRAVQWLGRWEEFSVLSIYGDPFFFFFLASISSLGKCRPAPLHSSGARMEQGVLENTQPG